jgi:PAS domain S-box-containing protein
MKHTDNNDHGASIEELNKEIAGLKGEGERAISNLPNLRALTAMINAAGEGLALIDRAGTILMINPAFAEMHGVAEEEAINKNISHYYIQAHQPLAEKAVVQAMEKGNYYGEIKHQGPNGGSFPALERITSIKGDKGESVGFVVVTRDISALKDAEYESWESEFKYREIVQNANSIIIRWNMQGEITFFNQYARQFFGYSEKEILGRNLVGAIVPETESSGRNLASVLDDIKRSPELFASTVNENIKKNGERVWISWTNKAIFDRDREIVGILSIGNDITERKRIQDELATAQRLESVGNLVSGISHEFNNILTEVFGNIGAAKQYLDLTLKVFDRLAEADKAALRARKLTAQLLSFSKGAAEARRASSVAALIEDSASLVLRGSNVVCDFSLPDDLNHVEVDQEFIFQVMTTLLINAQQAMPDGGLITVTAVNMDIPPDSGLPLSPGQYVKISVEDEGVGIAPDHLNRIFDPYFTTKRERAGLGLATVYSILKKHRGHIEVRSVVNQGTGFDIYLPISGPSQNNGRDDLQSRGPLSRIRKVLVVDDDQSSRIAAGEFLTLLGYDVAFATNTAEALIVAQQNISAGDRLAAMLVNSELLNTPDEQQPLSKLVSLEESTSAIIVGSPGEQVFDSYMAFGFKGAMEKPYGLNRLSAVLEEVIS